MLAILAASRVAGSAIRWKVLRLERGEWQYCGEYSATSIQEAARAAKREYPDALLFRLRPAPLPREPWRDCTVG